MEAVLQRLVDSGISGPLAVRCYSFLITYTIGFVTYTLPRPWGGSDNPDAAEWRRRRSHFYAGLPIDDFPVMVSLAQERTLRFAGRDYARFRALCWLRSGPV